MSYMNHTAFDTGCGIQQLSFSELDLVGGGDTAGDVRDAAIWVSAGAAMVAGASAVGVVSAPAAAPAAIVSGAAAVVAAVANMFSDD